MGKTMNACETKHIATAAASLNDDMAREIAACVEILKVESDLDKRRVAENRFLRLTEGMKP